MFADSLRSFKSKLQKNFNSSDKRATIQDSDFIIGLLQGVAKSKNNFTLAELRLAVCTFIGSTICRSAFNERISTKNLAEDLKLALKLLLNLISKKSTNDINELALKLGVTTIVGVDGSMVTLWDGLCDFFKGTFMVSSAKLHLATNLVTGAVNWFDITSGATHDSQCFPGIKSKTFYIFDLGYWSKDLFKLISTKSSFFLSRVKSNARLTVIEIVYGIGTSIIGQDLARFRIKKNEKILSI